MMTMFYALLYNYLACTNYYTIICVVLHWKTTMQMVEILVLHSRWVIAY